MREIPRDQITVDPAVNPRRRLDRPTIENYVDSYDETPPVTVYEVRTPEGLQHLLTDGFHRIAAADARGEKMIRAEVKRGTREEAMMHAASANMKHGRPLTPEERHEAIKRMDVVRPGLGHTELAKALGVPIRTVERVRSAVKVQEVTESGTLPLSHYEAVARAAQKHWAPLVTAATDHQWSRDEIRAAVAVTKSRKVDEAEKQRVLDGGTPFINGTNGDAEVLTDTLKRKMDQARESDDLTPLWGALEAVAVLQTRLDQEASFEGLTADQIRRAQEQLDRGVGTLSDARGRLSTKLGVSAA